MLQPKYFMIRHLLTLCLFVMNPFLVVGQSLDLSVTPQTAGNSPNVFSLAGDARVELQDGGIRFLNSANSAPFAAVGVSPDRSVVSLVQARQGEAQITLLDAHGDSLNDYPSISMRTGDPSLSIFPSNGGHVLLRHDIMNFTFYNGLGTSGASISGSSGSQLGQTMPQLAMDPNRKTIIVYTTKIKKGNALGSLVERLDSDKRLKKIFQHDSRYIKELTVSDDGNFVTVVTAAEGTDDQVTVMDKYGNKIKSLSTDKNLEGASLSAGGKYLTLYSESRISVYNILSGERIGSTTLTDLIFLTNYFPEDHKLLILNGDYSPDAGVLNNIEVKVVDFAKREIVSEPYAGSLGFHEAFVPEFEQLSPNRYQLNGASRELIIDVRF